MKKKRILALTLACMLSASVFAGCSDNSGGSSSGGSSSNNNNSNGGSSSGGTGTVYWLNFKPEADTALNEIAEKYKEETGVEVKVSTASSGTYEQSLSAEMDKSSAPTLFVINNADALKLWSDYCYDLKDTDVYKELTDTSSAFVYTADDKTCAIAYCYETFGLIVNKKLLDQAGYSVDDIKDFDSLKSIAEDIHSRASELGFDAFTSSGLDGNSSWRFSGHLANMPLYYESLDDGWTECPATIKGTYLENFKNVWDLYINNSAYDPSTLASAGYDAEAEFGKGEAVFYQNGSWEYSALVDTYGMNSDDIQMIPIYCGVEGEENIGLCSGTENLWAVNSKASEEDIQATLDFMYWMVTSEEGTKCMAEQFGEIPYKGAAENENVFFQNANALIDAGKTTVEWTFNYTPNVEEWRAAVVAAMTQYCAGGSWDDVETAFVDGWAAQYTAANS